jgi:hypothetical protein
MKETLKLVHSASTISTATRFEVSEFDLLDDSEKLEASEAHNEQLLQTLTQMKEMIDGTVSSRQHYPNAETKTIRLKPGIRIQHYSRRAPLVQDVEPSAVPLHALIRFGSGFLLLVCGMSFILWLADLPFVITPFAASMGIVASPFFYWMGRKIREQTLISRDLSTSQED